MLDSPLIVAVADGLDVEVVGTVHALSRTASLAVKEIVRFSPDHVCVELKAPGQPTRSYEILEVRSRFFGRIIAIDRSIDITIWRYMSSTPPLQFFIEALVKYIFIPINSLSILLFNWFPAIYAIITSGRFFTFGWTWNDKKVFIFERDEYMAGKVAEMIRSDRDKHKEKSYTILVGRRHVAGIISILEAYRSTGGIGSYYAGGKIYDVFSISGLEEPYTTDYEASCDLFAKNRLIESLLRYFFLPLYMIALFAMVAAVVFIAAAIVFFIIKRL